VCQTLGLLLRITLYTTAALVGQSPGFTSYVQAASKRSSFHNNLC